MYNELSQVKDVLENLKVSYKSCKNMWSEEGDNPFERRSFATSLSDLGVNSDSDGCE